MDNLSPSAIDYINQSKGCCPACELGELRGGPWGGCSRNFRCELCGKEFNLAIFPRNHPVTSEPLLPDESSLVCMGQALDRNEPGLYKGQLLSEVWGLI